MNARHVINTQDNTRHLNADPCRAIDPVYQLQLSGAERLECAACGRPVEELPEPVSLWGAEVAPGVLLVTTEEPRR